MTPKTNFFDLVISCTSEFKSSIKENKDEKYIDTLYIAINKDDEVIHSITPDIITDNSKYIILIHQYVRLASTNYYPYYNIQTIDNQLCVHCNKLDDNFSIEINRGDQFGDRVLVLYFFDEFRNNEIFKCKWPMESQLKIVWDVYQRCLKCHTNNEVKLLGKLAMSEQRTLKLQKDLENANFLSLFLEKECDKYKSLLDEIKILLSTKIETTEN